MVGGLNSAACAKYGGSGNCPGVFISRAKRLVNSLDVLHLMGSDELDGFKEPAISTDFLNGRSLLRRELSQLDPVFASGCFSLGSQENLKVC